MYSKSLIRIIDIVIRFISPEFLTTFLHLCTSQLYRVWRPT